jgi:phenylpropionate dioxygenase-like ring-hydroxylating dioxygenase large terminal subunit
MCPYHGWAYANNGDLLGVTAPEGYPPDFVSKLSGLLKLRTAVYRGLIFASMNDDVPSIEEHLGDVRKYVDWWADLSPEPEFSAAPPHHYAYDGNWKFQVENSNDGWHARFTHESAFQSFAERMKLSRSEAEDFLYREAEFLDNREYDKWLNLFTSDAVYWLPMIDNSDPELVPSVIYDNMHNLKMRVHQLSKRHYAQRPPSRTMHSISNVIVAASEATNEVVVRCGVFVTELREGDYQQLGLGEQRLFSGHCEYRLRQEDKLSIARKKLLLMNRDVPIVNLSFLL